MYLLKMQYRLMLHMIHPKRRKLMGSRPTTPPSPQPPARPSPPAPPPQPPPSNVPFKKGF